MRYVDRRQIIEQVSVRGTYLTKPSTGLKLESFFGKIPAGERSLHTQWWFGAVFRSLVPHKLVQIACQFLSGLCRAHFCRERGLFSWRFMICSRRHVGGSCSFIPHRSDDLSFKLSLLLCSQELLLSRMPVVG